MRTATIGLCSALALGSLLFTQPAFAGDEAAAEALFGEAKKLAAAGKFAEACPKFAESNRLDRGAGTMIHLGDCYEKNKQTASAWATYKEASSAAQAINRKDWETLATKRAAMLETKLAHLTIKVDPGNDGAKTEVSRDGTTVSSASWNLAIPVDVGSHAVEAHAAGMKGFSTSITVTKDGENVDVVIPKLDPDPNATPATPPPGPSPITVAPPVVPPEPDADTGKGGSSQRSIGFIVAGIGVAGLAVGGITGLMAIGKSNDAKDKCASGPCPDKTAVDSANSAHTLATISTIGFIAGGVGVAAGAVLIFTAPSPRKTGVRVIPSAGPGSAGLTVLGAF